MRFIVYSEDINNKIKFEKEEALLDDEQEFLAAKKLWASKETIDGIRAVLSTMPKEVQSGSRKSFGRTSEIFKRRERKTRSEQAADESAN